MKTFPDAPATGMAETLDYPGQVGLTKREIFAKDAPVKELLMMYYDKTCGTLEQCADVAVKYADALIAELNK